MTDGQEEAYRDMIIQLRADLARVTGQRDRLREDLDRKMAEGLALCHAGHTPSLDRIRTAHTLMTEADFRGGHYEGHRPYSNGEQCYLCAVLAVADKLKGQRDRATAVVVAMKSAAAFVVAREIIGEAGGVTAARAHIGAVDPAVAARVAAVVWGEGEGSHAD